MSNEAFSQVKIDSQLRDVSWSLADCKSVRYEYVLSDGTRAAQVLRNRCGFSLAVMEAKGAIISQRLRPKRITIGPWVSVERLASNLAGSRDTVHCVRKQKGRPDHHVGYLPKFGLQTADERVCAGSTGEDKNQLSGVVA